MSLFNLHFFHKKNIYVPNYNRYCHRKTCRNYITDRKINHYILLKLKDANKSILKKKFGWNCHLQVSRPRRVGGDFFSNLKFNNLRMSKKFKKKFFFPNKTLSARGVSLRREAIRKKTIILFWPKIELFALLYLFYYHNHGKHFLTCSLKQFTLKIQNSLQFFFSFSNESFLKRVSQNRQIYYSKYNNVTSNIQLPKERMDKS